MFAQAMEMGMMETIGFSWRDTDRIIARLKTVTAAQVKDVAARYFGDDALTVAVLDPQPLPQGEKAHKAPPATSRH
jgi:zinc protease